MSVMATPVPHPNRIHAVNGQPRTNSNEIYTQIVYPINYIFEKENILRITKLSPNANILLQKWKCFFVSKLLNVVRIAVF